MSEKIKNVTIGFLLLHALWFFGHFFVDARLIPSPLVVYGQMDGTFWRNMQLPILHSLWRLVLAMSISLGIGLVFGVLLSGKKTVGKILNPFLYFIYPIPKMAFLPVVIISLGLGNGTIVTMIVLIIVFQMMINVRDGVNNIPVENYQTLLVLGANRWQLFKDVTLPAALSQILSSTRVALGTATAILFITEDSGNIYGVGRFIFNAHSRIDFVNVYTGIVVLSLMAFFLFLLLDVIERRFMKWHQ